MNIAMIAHDNKKLDLCQWAVWNKDFLNNNTVYATGTTGTRLTEIGIKNVVKLKSGPLGGDQQVGAKIAEGEIDLLIFFWDALTSQPHDPDIKALLRLAVLVNIPIACNRKTADMLVTSVLVTKEP
jgi:methylglyoxal synthase